jgi:hypothetical protein
VKLIDMPSVDVDDTLVPGVAIVDTVLAIAVSALGAKLLGGTNVTVYDISVAVASPGTGSFNDIVRSSDDAASDSTLDPTLEAGGV